MPATATITGTTDFRVEADPDTANVDHLALPGATTYEVETDTVAQIRIDADDGVNGDPQQVELKLMAAGAAFTVDAGTDVCTSAAHGLSDNDQVRVSSTTTLPAGLTAATPYYIINSATNTFKLALSPGGAAIDITTTGTGTHSWQYYGAPVITYEYPTTGPEVPVTIKTNRDGGVNDFTAVKGFHVRLVPTVKEATVKGTFTADAGTNVITTSADHLRSVGSRIQFESAGTLPAGLVADTDYYVLTVPASNTMTVAASAGGSVIDITDTGSGTHSWSIVGDAYGEVWVTMGDSTDRMNFISVPLLLDYTAGEANAEVFWVGSIPAGATYDTDYHLEVHINDSTPRMSENLTILVNLLGN